ncbi:MAG: NYN domain-containing protein [Candidatus Saccharibacteria bacterium]|nr:NYN domain-containing protein [Candidatus Saccharibacteria bacterium]
MENNVAVFVDAENLTFWTRNGGVQALMDDLRSQGHVVVRKAYGKWSTPQLEPLQTEFNINGFELVQTYHPVSGKNSTDIKMTVDAMEFATNPNLQTIVLATGDSDFSPLFRKLRELGKEVIGVGPKSRLSECVQNSCSRYIYTESEYSFNNVIETVPTYNKKFASQKVDAFTTLHKIMERQDAPILLTTLKPLMLAEDRTFDHYKLGYKSFKDFLLASGEIKLSDIIAGPVYASLINKEPPAEEDSTTKLVRALKSKGWDIVPKEIIQGVYEIVSNDYDYNTKTHFDWMQIIPASDIPGITTQYTSKALSTFFKADMVKINTVDDEKFFNVIRYDDYLKRIDSAMLLRLDASAKERGIQVNFSDVKEILLGDYTEEELSQLVNTLEK